MADSDEKLMTEFQTGEPRAFEVLLDRHQSRIYNFFLRNFGQPELARDLTQETFLRVVRGRQAFRQDARFSTWMWRIARNLRVDTLRRLKFRRHDSLDAPIGSDPDGATRLERVADGADPGAERTVHGERFVRALRAAIPDLEEEQREVFVLRQLQGLSFQEIADIQDVNVNTVKSRMRYALKKLRAALAEFAPPKETL